MHFSDVTQKCTNNNNSLFPELIFRSTYSLLTDNSLLSFSIFHRQFIAWIYCSHAPYIPSGSSSISSCGIHPMSCIHNLFVFPKTDSIVNILPFPIESNARNIQSFVFAEKFFVVDNQNAKKTSTENGPSSK